MAIRRCPYCKAIIDESQKYCNNCGTQLLFPEDDSGEEPIKGEKIVDEDFPGNGEDRIPEDPVDELREDLDIDLEPADESEEIDLEKIIEGEASLDENVAGDSGLVDLREAEPASVPAGGDSEEIRIEKPVTVEAAAAPEIRIPEPSDPDEAAIPRREKPLSKKKQDGGRKEVPAAAPKEKPYKLAPPKREVTPPVKIKGDQNTKFEIARLIADFEKRRRTYTTDLEAPPAEEPVEEPLVPPSEEEIGTPPNPEELEKEADALREGTEGDFATDYEFAPEDKAGGAEKAEEKAGSTDDRISRLVGGFKAVVDSVGEAEEEPDSHTRHPEFMTGDVVDDQEPKEQPEPPPSVTLPEEDQAVSDPYPAFVTTDFEPAAEAKESMPPEPPALPNRDEVIQAARRDFGNGFRREESPIPEPPAHPQAPADERAVLIARILKKRAEKLAAAGENQVSRETSEALAALKFTNASEIAKPAAPEESQEIKIPEEAKEPEKPVEIPATGEIRKPAEEEELPSFVLEEIGEFRADEQPPSEELPSVPTMGIPEALPKTSPPLPVEFPAEEEEEEEEEELKLDPEPEPEPVAPPVARRSRIRAPEAEAAPPAPIIAEETPQREEPPAPAPLEPLTEKPSVRAPVVRLGFFRRIKATVFDLLVVGAFWAGATALTAHFLSVPVVDLIISAALPLGLLFAVLLAIYLFMFFLFLGETPGGRLAMPRN